MNATLRNLAAVLATIFATNSSAQEYAPSNVSTFQRGLVDIISISETDVLAALWLNSGNLESMRDELPISDRNPIRLPRLQDEMLQEISETRARIQSGQPIDVTFPATRVLISDYDAATNSFTLLLPGVVFARFRDRGSPYRLELTYPWPLSDNSGTVCCGNDYMGTVSRGIPNAAAVFSTGHYRRMVWRLDSTETAERVYDAENENRLFAHLACEMVGPYGNHGGSIACPVTGIYLSIGGRNDGMFSSVGDVYWENGQYQSQFR